METDIRRLAPWEWSIWRLTNCNPATYDYLVRFSEAHAAVYVQNPKAASLTIKKTLEIAGGVGGFSSMGDAHRGGADVRADALLRSDEYFRFTFVRNPYSRILSAYLNKIVEREPDWLRLKDELGFGDGKPTFRAFLHRLAELDPIWIDFHFKSQCRILRPDLIRYHSIGRFERFALDFPPILRRIFGDRAETAIQTIDYHRTAANDRLDDYYDPETRNIVFRLFLDDFETFGYAR